MSPLSLTHFIDTHTPTHMGVCVCVCFLHSLFTHVRGSPTPSLQQLIAKKRIPQSVLPSPYAYLLLTFSPHKHTHTHAPSRTHAGSKITLPFRTPTCTHVRKKECVCVCVGMCVYQKCVPNTFRCYHPLPPLSPLPPHFPFLLSQSRLM